LALALGCGATYIRSQLHKRSQAMKRFFEWLDRMAEINPYAAFRIFQPPS
jgi:hypothetical protein